MTPPRHLGELCAADLAVRSITTAEGDVVLAITTDEQRIDVSNCSGDWERAAEGCDHLAAAAAAHAKFLRERARWQR